MMKIGDISDNTEEMHATGSRRPLGHAMGSTGDAMNSIADQSEVASVPEYGNSWTSWIFEHAHH
jgi:hypothetical protein